MKDDLRIHFVRCSEGFEGGKLSHPIYGVSIVNGNGTEITLKEDSLHTLGMLLEDRRERKEVFEKIELFEFDY